MVNIVHLQGSNSGLPKEDRADPGAETGQGDRSGSGGASQTDSPLFYMHWPLGFLRVDFLLSPGL